MHFSTDPILNLWSVILGSFLKANVQKGMFFGELLQFQIFLGCA